METLGRGESDCTVTAEEGLGLERADLELLAERAEEGEDAESAESLAIDAARTAVEKFQDYLSDCFDNVRIHCSKTAREEDEDLGREGSNSINSLRKACGLVYDQRCLQHEHPTGSHPERPARILSIMKTLELSGLSTRMARIDAVPISPVDVLRVHSSEHLKKLDDLRDPALRDRVQIELKNESAFANEHSTDAALISAGGVLELVRAVVAGTVKNGIAVVRPPGHHAEECCVKGFCLINNVAVAAAWATSRTRDVEDHDVRAVDAFDDVDVNEQNFKKYRRTRRNFRPVPAECKVLIVDFDVHHGNGTQNMFYENPNVLFFSVHRHDNGWFYPGGAEAGPNSVGSGEGFGCNINVGWNGGSPGDLEYFAVWEQVLLPAARNFDPDLVIVSAGFDAADGDPLGGCFLTPAGYGVLVHQLMSLAEGRIVLALEGGYSLDALAQSSLICAAVLLGNPPPRLAREQRPPTIAALNSIGATIRAHKNAYWMARQVDGISFNPVLNWAATAPDPTVADQSQQSLYIHSSHFDEGESGVDESETSAYRASPSSHSISSALLPSTEGDPFHL